MLRQGRLNKPSAVLAGCLPPIVNMDVILIADLDFNCRYGHLLVVKARICWKSAVGMGCLIG
jgi:hypothetical protein